MNENDITYKIRGAAFKVHTILGPGLLESVYEAAMAFELTSLGLEVRSQVGVPVTYEGIKLQRGFRMDLLVGEAVIIEIKSIEALHPVHFKQVLTYLRLSNKRIGVLINFNVYRLEDKKSIVRLANNFNE